MQPLRDQTRTLPWVIIQEAHCRTALKITPDVPAVQRLSVEYTLARKIQQQRIKQMLPRVFAGPNLPDLPGNIGVMSRTIENNASRGLISNGKIRPADDLSDGNETDV